MLRRRVSVSTETVGEGLSEGESGGCRLETGLVSVSVSVATSFCFAMQTNVKSRWTVRGFLLVYLILSDFAATNESEAKKERR